jgi:Tfp pilus assembly protein PilN
MAELNSTVNRARAAGTPSVGFPWRLLIISVVVFGLSVLVWAGISFGYVPYLNSQINGADSAFNALSSKIDINQQQSLTDFYSQLYNIQTLQGTHIYPSKLFDFLEKNVYPTVKLTSMQTGITGGDLSFEGLAVDYATLTNELAILKTDPNILTVSLDSSRQRAAKDGGGVNFSIRVTFNPSYFRSQ